MPNLTYLKVSDNLIPAATVTADSEDANFLAVNLQSPPVSQPWKSDSVGGSPEVTPKTLIDLGSAQAIDIVGLVNHNLTSAAVITLRAGSAPDPSGSPGFQTTITWAKGIAWIILSAAETWRYWSITISDSANPDGHVRFGYLALGSSTALTVNFQAAWDVVRKKIVRRVENDLGVPMVGAKIAEGSMLTLKFAGLTDAQRTEIDSLLSGLDLEVDPLLLVPDPSETEAYFARLIEEHTLGRDYPVTNIPSAVFQTDNFGTAIPA